MSFWERLTHFLGSVHHDSLVDLFPWEFSVQIKLGRAVHAEEHCDELHSTVQKYKRSKLILTVIIYIKNFFPETAEQFCTETAERNDT